MAGQDNGADDRLAAVPARPPGALRRLRAAARAAGRASALPGALLARAGLASSSSVAQCHTWDATAELTGPLVALAVAGSALMRWRRAPGALGVALPPSPCSPPTRADRALRARPPSPATSGSTTPPPGWPSPTGSWSTVAAWPAWTRRPTRRRSRSTSATGIRSASSCRWASARELTGQDVAWLIQPYMAFGAARARRWRLWQLAEPLVRSRRCARRSSLHRRAAGPALRLLPMGGHQGGGGRGAAGGCRRGWRRCAIRAAVRARGRSIPLAVGGAAPDRGAERRRGIWLLRGPAAGCWSFGRARARARGRAAERPPPSRSSSRSLCVPVLASGGFLPPDLRVR